MKKYFPILIIVLGVIYQSSGQNGIELKNQFATSIYRYERITETLHGIMINRIFNGLFYERYINKGLSGIIGIEYGNNVINDDCEGCADHLYGEGKFEEVNILLGTNYHINLSKVRFIKPYTQIDIYYSKSKYSGYFGGGFDGQGCYIDHTYNKYGLIGRLGLLINPISKITLSASTALKVGKFKEKIETYIDYMENSWIPVELRIGVKF
jgi:hypothetical protein